MKENDVKVLFVNQFDLFMNNSAGITVRDLFGDTFCKEMPKLCIINNRITYEKEETRLTCSFSIKDWGNVVKVLKAEKPDIVYTTASSAKVLLFLLFIKKRLGIPVLIHYFDNWRETGSKKVKNLILKMLNGTHERALVISDEMNEHYKEKYGGHYTTLMVGTTNEVSINMVKNGNDPTIRIMYAGGLHLGRVHSLLEVENIIRNDEAIELVIATFKDGEGYSKYRNLFDENKTTFLLDIPHEEMVAYYRNVDALLFVENAPEDKLTFLKYSMSTKIPEYLSSGLPIVCYAKEGIACYEYFRRTQTALLATSSEDLKDAITKLKNKEYSDLVKRAKEIAARDFDRSFQRNVLRNVMQELINNV